MSGYIKKETIEKRREKSKECELCGQPLWRGKNLDGTAHYTTCLKTKDYIPLFKKNDKIIVFWQKIISVYRITKDTKARNGYYHLKLLWYKDNETNELILGNSYKLKPIKLLDKYARPLTEMDEMLYE